MVLSENLERLSRLLVGEGPQTGVKAGSRAEIEKLLCGCYGRIVRSRSLPETLSEDRGRKLVMVMGADGLLSMAGLTPLQMLERIGYRSQYVQEKVKEGTRFFLVLFQLDQEEVLPATWPNLIRCAAGVYANTSDILYGALDYLETTPFEKFEAEVGYRLCEVGENDQRFVDLDRLLVSDCSPQMVRKFFYHTLRLNELFTGTGVTLTEEGESGVREYVIADRKIEKLSDAVLVELNVECGS